MIRRYKYINLESENFLFDNKKIIIWGLSESALAAYVSFKAQGIEVIGFTDSFVEKEGDIFVDLPIFTYEQIKEMNTPIIYISTINYEYQKHILNLTDNISNAIVLCNGEVWGPGEYDIKRLKNAEIVNRAAYSHSTKLEFKNDYSSGSSHIVENEGNSIVKTISIDEMLAGNPATFIKMDIEGAELEALEGCKETIIKFRPKLAISIYHKENDLWKIPYYIIKNYPFYKLYIRHYTTITTETVLYATV